MPVERKVTYTEIHDTIQNALHLLENDNRPQFIVSVSGGGDVPARILRTALGAPTIPIYHVGVRSYSDIHIGEQQKEVEVYQWIESNTLSEWKQQWARILIVDDIIDSTKTIQYVADRLRNETGPHTQLNVYSLYGKKPPPLMPFVDSCFIGEKSPKKTWVVMPWE